MVIIIHFTKSFHNKIKKIKLYVDRMYKMNYNISVIFYKSLKFQKQEESRNAQFPKSNRL